MKINAREPICGLRPALVKRLAKEYEPFSLAFAADILGLPEQVAEEKMQELCDAGYMTADADRWHATELGIRLANAKLNVKRFPRSQGMEIVQRVIAEAERINRERHSRCIAKIILFGSCLTADDNELIGDVDLIVVVEPRQELPRAERDELERRELNERYFVNVIERAVWHQTRLLKRIK